MWLSHRQQIGEVRTATTTVHRAVYRTDRHASVNLVYHNRSGMDDHDEEKRREEKRTDQNRTEVNCTQQ